MGFDARMQMAVDMANFRINMLKEGNGEAWQSCISQPLSDNLEEDFYFKFINDVLHFIHHKEVEYLDASAELLRLDNGN